MRATGALLAWILLLAPAGGVAQSIPGGVSSLAVMWAQGEYRAPMICEIEGQPMRALRRVTIRAGSPRGTRLTGRLMFFDLEAPPDTHCYGETGGDQPNLIGSLTLELGGRSSSDTAQHDFDQMLDRKGGFLFDVTSGSLRVGPPGTPLSELPVLNLRRGSVQLDAVKRGSDAFRRLAEFGGREKRTLILTTADGSSWSFDLVAWDAPPGRPRR